MSGNTKLYQTKSFKVAIGVPILLAAVLACVLYKVEGAPQFFSQVWGAYKIPMTLASLTIPLVAWVAANHRSEQTIKALELQSDKRLYEMYFEQQKHFETVMGRRVSNAKFKYVTQEDLPVIYSELYEFNRIKEKGEVSLKPTAVAEMNRFLNQTGEIVYSFFAHFTEHKEKSPDQMRVLDNFILQMYQNLQRNIHILSNELGFKFIDLSDSSVEIYQSAYTEIMHLAYYMGDDFKEVWDLEQDERSSSYEDILNTFSAIETVIRKHMGVVGEVNFSNFHNGVASREVINYFNSSPLQQLVRKTCQDFLDEISDMFGIDDISVIEGKYEKFLFPTREGVAKFELWFDELADNKGDLVLVAGEVEHRARFAMSNEKIDANGDRQIKYQIDNDLGEKFKAQAYQLFSEAFASSKE